MSHNSEFNLYQETTRTDQARRIQELKRQDLNCSKCSNYSKKSGKCIPKDNRVKSYNICDSFGKVFIK
jgi:hypothetical protein